MPSQNINQLKRKTISCFGGSSVLKLMKGLVVHREPSYSCSHSLPRSLGKRLRRPTSSKMAQESLTRGGSLSISAVTRKKTIPPQLVYFLFTKIPPVVGRCAGRFRVYSFILTALVCFRILGASETSFFSPRTR